jgi:hypothetical protein
LLASSVGQSKRGSPTVQPIGARDLEVLAPMRGVGEKLLRDAADVDAGAAEAAGSAIADLGAVAAETRLARTPPEPPPIVKRS